MPWVKLDRRDLPPALMLAALRTMTAVIGNPPNKPLMILPIPCALSSRLVGARRFKGSSLSVASRLNRVSKLAIIAIVTATR